MASQDRANEAEVEPGRSAVTVNVVPQEQIRQLIVLLRGEKVMLDADLAGLYEVETGELVRAVKRNLDRFPVDFMFQLTDDEFKSLKSHWGPSASWGGRRHRPHAFTEQGVAMLSSVLRSGRAIRVNVEIIRAFVQLRRLLQSNADLTQRLDALEKKYDSQFRVVFDAIRELMTPSAVPKRGIGFRPGPK